MTNSHDNEVHHVRDLIAAAALDNLPKILTLQDRNPLSPTYGCFDRSYWHIRMKDFPCGMSQEFALPLALAWALPIPGNRFHAQPEIRRWAEAGIRYAARSAHADGACDDYYPFEKAAGAAAFSLYACLEAAEILGLEGDPELGKFFALRAGWLAHHEESGRLSNHEAIIIACLARMTKRHGGDWAEALRRRVDRLLGWQSAEGWFDEYGGADPGYLSLTIGMLALADRDLPELGLRPHIDRAIGFLAHCLHPDGSLGGEYTSRATTNFFPHGLEICGAWNREALALADRAYLRFEKGNQPCHADDWIIGHHTWSQLIAWREWQGGRPGPLLLEAGLHDFPEAGIRVQQSGPMRLYCGWSRGAAFRLYDREELLHADTGISLRLDDGRVVVSHLGGGREIARTDEMLEVEGPMSFAKSTLPTPLRLLALRMVMLTVGRFFPDLVRRLLQKILVTGRKDAPFRFRRRLKWQGQTLCIEDEIHADEGWNSVVLAGAGGFQVSLTTVMSRVWEPAQFQPWQDLTDRIGTLGPGEALRVQRIFEPSA